MLFNYNEQCAGEGTHPSGPGATVRMELHVAAIKGRSDWNTPLSLILHAAEAVRPVFRPAENAAHTAAPR